MQRVIYTLVLLASFFPLHVSGGEIKIVGSLGLTGKYRYCFLFCHHTAYMSSPLFYKQANK
jgi:hypothetical protein